MLLRVIGLIILSVAFTTSSAQVPDIFSFQGRITQQTVPAETMIDITTNLYQNGVEVFTQTHTDVSVDSTGVFNLDIGPLGNVLFDQPTELGITIGTDPEISPRTVLTSVPFSHGLKLPFLGEGSAAVHSGLFLLKTDGGGAGVRVDSSGGPGFSVDYALTDGLEVLDAQNDGVQIVSAGQNGLLVQATGNHGIRITDPTVDGLRIEDAGDDGIDIQTAAGDGVFIGLVGSPPVANFSSVDENGVQIVGTGGHGVFIGGARNDGVRVEQALSSGFSVTSAGVGLHVDTVSVHGVLIEHAFGDGLKVRSADSDGIQIESADEDGILVDAAGRYAANLKAPHLTGALEQSHILSHVALVHNTFDSDQPLTGQDVLALKIEDSSPGTNDNFMTFFDEGDNPLGSVEGSGAGGVVFNSSGADYAEFLRLADGAAAIEGGDVVGVHDGTISRDTRDADKIMVVTDNPIVLANSPGQNTEGFTPVSFTGQVRVKVEGQVESGDYLVASGWNDGLAVSVSKDEITPANVDLLVGQAWESSADSGVKRVNTAIGIDQSQVLLAIIERQQRQIDELRDTILGGSNH